MGIRSTIRRLEFRGIGRLPWYTALIIALVVLPLIPILVWLIPGPRRSADWVEVSRGEFLRAVRHVPTNRCFVRYNQGGIVETNADVCRSSR